MPTVADVLRRYGGDYLEQFGATMPVEHKKVLRAITACRTGALGTVLYACQSCGRTHMVGRSCGNRHCPSCQQEKGYRPDGAADNSVIQPVKVRPC